MAPTLYHRLVDTLLAVDKSFGAAGAATGSEDSTQSAQSSLWKPLIAEALLQPAQHR